MNKERIVKINLPRGYLSYSACMLWRDNPSLYRKRYYENEKQEESVPMRFGKKIAEVLESRDYREYPELKKVPFFPVSEHPLVVNVGGVIVKGFLDLYTPESFAFGEVKTGSVSHVKGPPWTKARVMAHDQLPWYSLMIKTAYGKVEPKCSLIWLETKYKMQADMVGSRLMEGEGRDLELTGRMEVFERKIAEWERKRIKELIIASAEEITKDYNLFLKR